MDREVAIEKYGELRNNWFDRCVNNAYPEATIPPGPVTLFWWSFRYLLDPETPLNWREYWAYKVESSKQIIKKSRPVRRAKVAIKRRKIRKKRKRK